MVPNPTDPLRTAYTISVDAAEGIYFYLFFYFIIILLLLLFILFIINDTPNRCWYDCIDITTGISAHDRARTVRLLASPNSTSVTFSKPGHILPLRAREGGVLVRRGHTEASVDLCKLAGCAPVAAIGELVKDEDGLMMRRDDCLEFAKKHNLKISTIEALEKYIRQKEQK